MVKCAFGTSPGKGPRFGRSGGGYYHFFFEFGGWEFGGGFEFRSSSTKAHQILPKALEDPTMLRLHLIPNSPGQSQACSCSTASLCASCAPQAWKSVRLRRTAARTSSGVSSYRCGVGVFFNTAGGGGAATAVLGSRFSHGQFTSDSGGQHPRSGCVEAKKQRVVDLREQITPSTLHVPRTRSNVALRIVRGTHLQI